MPQSANDENTADNELTFADRLKRMVEADGFRDVCYLISKGVPFDLAWSMEAEERLAYTIVFGELAGGIVWSYSQMKFVPTTPSS